MPEQSMNRQSAWCGWWAASLYHFAEWLVARWHLTGVFNSSTVSKTTAQTGLWPED